MPNVLDLGGGLTLEWEGCPACLDPNPCGFWLGANETRICEPYPCRCDEIDDDPPDWLARIHREQHLGPVFQCRPYIAKKGRNAGRWVNFCRCWGMSPDGRPDDCCAHHQHNPYTMHPEFRQGLAVFTIPSVGSAPVDVAGGPGADDFTAPVVEALPALRVGHPLGDMLDADKRYGSETESYSEPNGRTFPAPLDGAAGAVCSTLPIASSLSPRAVETLYADALGIPVDVEPEPYARRWSHEELHCACRTPWDHLVTKDGKVAAKGIGYHCSACHRNFRNVAVAGIHQPEVTAPCVDPARIVDIERGTPVLRLRLEGVAEVWG